VLETLSKNIKITKKILTELIDKIPTTRSCSCAKALEEAEF
jgi:5'-methylthioadenosine phosphorylase